MKKYAALAAWIACGVLAYGMTMGHFTRKFPTQRCEGVSVLMGIWGPVGLFAGPLLNPPYHFRLKPMTDEERWKEFHSLYPHLDRKYFDGDD